MKLKALISTTIISAILICIALASGGTETDPLISLSFLRGEFLENIYYTAYDRIETETDSMYSEYVNALDSGDVGQLVPMALDSGDGINLTSGDSFILTSGTARITINSGEVVNVTVAGAAQTGVVVQNTRYILMENTHATIKASVDSIVFIDSKDEAGTMSFFLDISPTDWFYDDVIAATTMGLINGMTSTTFAPTENISYSQVIKLAATTHQYYEDGDVSLENGEVWYQPYVDYAMENGIITSEPADYSAAAPREYYIAVMYNALPESEYEAINDIADNAVPDVQEGDDFYEKIYTFYRAGIVTGGDEANSFLPKQPVLRNEVATLVARMFDESVRKTFSID